MIIHINHSRKQADTDTFSVSPWVFGSEDVKISRLLPYYYEWLISSEFVTKHPWSASMKMFVFDESFCPPEAKNNLCGWWVRERGALRFPFTYLHVYRRSPVSEAQRQRDAEQSSWLCVWGWLRQPPFTWAVHRHHLVADPVHSAVTRIPAKKHKLTSGCRCLQTCIVYTVNTKSVHSNQACQVFFFFCFPAWWQIFVPHWIEYIVTHTHAHATPKKSPLEVFSVVACLLGRQGETRCVGV